MSSGAPAMSRIVIADLIYSEALSSRAFFSSPMTDTNLSAHMRRSDPPATAGFQHLYVKINSPKFSLSDASRGKWSAILAALVTAFFEKRFRLAIIECPNFS
jgi:hypothetical protein